MSVWEDRLGLLWKVKREMEKGLTQEEKVTLADLILFCTQQNRKELEYRTVEKTG